MYKVHLVPECHAETQMVKIIFDNYIDSYFNHADGIHTVGKILKAKDVTSYVNIGFVDKDKKSTPFYFDEFEIVEKFENVLFKKHPQGKDYLVIVDPAIEKFILSQLSQIRKQPSDYGLPNDFKKFCKKMKSTRIANDNGYRQLIIDLKNANTSGINFISNCVRNVVLES